MSFLPRYNMITNSISYQMILSLWKWLTPREAQVFFKNTQYFCCFFTHFTRKHSVSFSVHSFSKNSVPIERQIL